MIVAWFAHLPPVWQAFLATCFTWLLTALGAAVVFLGGRYQRRALDGALGFARVRLGVRVALGKLRANSEARGYVPIAFRSHVGYTEATYVEMEKALEPGGGRTSPDYSRKNRE